MTRRRVMSVPASAMVALTIAMTLVGVVVAAPAGAATGDRLALQGRAPTSVELKVAVATGGLLSTSGVVWLNAATDSFGARLDVPLVTSSTEFDLRAVDKVIYLTSPNLATAAGPVWYTLRASWPALAAYARFLVQPRAAILRLLANVRVTHHGISTTYESRRTRVALGAVGATGHGSSSGAIDVRLTTGVQGEFTGLWVSLTSGAATTTVSMSVVSYNRPVSITAPVKGSATTPAGPLLKQLLSSGVLGSFVLPTRWLQLLRRAKLS